MVAEYVVELAIFQGPLDLLLHLIEKEELDITRIALAQVTDQYLAYLERMPQRDPAELSSFLTVAVKLLWIKSQALLPRSSVDDDEEDPGADLVVQLQEFRRYKQAAQQLKTWLDEGRWAFERLAAPPLIVPRAAELENATIEALVGALQDRMQELSVQEAIQPLQVRRRFTLADKARSIHTRLRHQDRILFSTLLSEAPSREEVVVTLWAVLELFKLRWILFEQEELFGPIAVCRRNDTDAEWDRGAEWWTELEDLD
jgi:segregation and condensation protein A